MPNKEQLLDARRHGIQLAYATDDLAEAEDTYIRHWRRNRPPNELELAEFRDAFSTLVLEPSK